MSDPPSRGRILVLRLVPAPQDYQIPIKPGTFFGGYWWQGKGLPGPAAKAP